MEKKKWEEPAVKPDYYVWDSIMFIFFPVKQLSVPYEISMEDNHKISG